MLQSSESLGSGGQDILWNMLGLEPWTDLQLYMLEHLLIKLENKSNLSNDISTDI